MGQRRHRTRHGELCRQRDPPVVASHGKETLSQCQTPDDHRRRRRQQRLSCAAMEGRASEARGRAQTSYYGLPLAAGHQQMEQDRASPVFVHPHDLAWQAVAQLSHYRPADRRDDDGYRPQSSSRIGRKQIPQRRQNFRRSTGRRQPLSPLGPRRLELHDLSKPKNATSKAKVTELFMDKPLAHGWSMILSENRFPLFGIMLWH